MKEIIVTAVDRDSGAPLAGAQINLFAEFEVAQQPLRQWGILGAGAAQEEAAWNSQLTGLVNELGRAMSNEVPAGMMAGIYGFCGAEFFDAFSGHPERRAAYIGFPSPATIGPVRGNVVQFRDLIVEEYRGQVGGTPFVMPRECYFVPVGIPELFVEVYAPADYTDTVNTLGLARYLRQEQLEFNKGTSLEAQMNVLPLCTIPRALFRAQAVDYMPPPFAGAGAGNNGRQAARR